MLMLCINYGIKRLSKLCKCILAPPVILTTSMHLQCSRMPAKVYYELSGRFGTRNVLTRTQGLIYWGGVVHPLARGVAIFHDKAKNY